MGFYQFHASQKIPSSLEEVWDFISSPANLKKITPEHMGFDIITPDLPDKMYPGMIIAYKVSPFMGIKMTWVTEITHVEGNAYFVDEQRIGPYSMWHHEHKIEAVEGGVLMSDIVSYAPPLGILGKLANSLFIRKQLKQIFDFREKAIISIFGEMKD